MKRVTINDFKEFIKKFVTVFASREFAFIYCILGTLGQISHCYYLVYSVSSFTGFFRVLQALLLALFISSSLMYFVSIADSGDEEKEYKRIKRAVNMFMYIEILMNMYYYAQHLIILAKPMRVFDFIFGAVISALIPVTIKLYSNSIRAKAWIKEIESKNQPVENIKIDLSTQKEEIKKIILEQFDDVKEWCKTIIDKAIEDAINTKLEVIQKGDVNGTSIDDMIFKNEIVKIAKEQINKELIKLNNRNEQANLTSEV